MSRNFGGDSGALAALAQRVREIATPEFQARLAQKLGATAVKLVADGFRGAHDPYGNPWPALQDPSRKRGGASAQPLRDTGRLLNAYHAQPAEGGFILANATGYAGPHQYGAQVAPHTRLNRSALIDRKGRFISAAKAKRVTFVQEWRGSATYGQGILIPRRQMVPESDTGGLGPIWGEAFNATADRAMKKHMGK